MNLSKGQLIEAGFTLVIALVLGGATKKFIDTGNLIGAGIGASQYFAIYLLWVWEDKTSEDKQSFIAKVRNVNVARYFFECRRGWNLSICKNPPTPDKTIFTSSKIYKQVLGIVLFLLFILIMTGAIPEGI